MIQDEAMKLAKLRQEETELQALVHLTHQTAQADSSVAALKRELARAQKRAQAERAAIKQGKEPTNKTPKLTIQNESGQYADVYINGHYTLRIPPFQSKSCLVEHKWNPTVLTGYGTGATSWGPTYIWGKYRTYTWHLD
jgi:hypothetical protein